jgi:hypothetical protein
MIDKTQLVDVQQWIKTRASLDAKESNFLSWTGNIYSFIPGEKRQLLFKIVGMSVSRCITTGEGSWDFTSRELTYYLNPETKEILHKWENPWTQETVTVMHVANSPVQGKFKGQLPVQLDGEKTNFVFDIFPNYPNPLAENPEFADYCPELHPILQQEINTRVPLYKAAPKSYIEGEDMTSWLYFQKHFSAYLAGEIFPIPAPEEV